MPSGGTDGLPREDISGKLTASLLTKMNSPDWKVSLFLRTLEILQMWMIKVRVLLMLTLRLLHSLCM